MDYMTTVNTVIEQHKSSPIDMLGIGDALGEYTYLLNLQDSYVRTVQDLDRHLGGERGGKRCLEVGSFLGVVSISLRKLGYQVSALDIPEFQKSERLCAMYERNGVEFGPINLRSSKIPYPSSSFDAVILCEILEHLNFNPLPALLEINRVLKPGGVIYIGMPNQASLTNRLRLLRGKSIHNPMQDFFLQLDRSSNMIVGLHWREYTMAETLELISKMGFETVENYYFGGNSSRSALKGVLKRLVYTHAPFRPFQVVVGQKVSTPTYDFWQTEANT